MILIQEDLVPEQRILIQLNIIHQLTLLLLLDLNKLKVEQHDWLKKHKLLQVIQLNDHLI